MWGVICVDKDIHFRSQVSLDNSFSQPTNYTHCKLRPGREQSVLSLVKSTLHCLLIGQVNFWLWESRDGFNNQVTGCGETQGWLRCSFQTLWLVKYLWKASDWSVSSHISIPSGFHKKVSIPRLDVSWYTTCDECWPGPGPSPDQWQLRGSEKNATPFDTDLI